MKKRNKIRIPSLQNRPAEPKVVTAEINATLLQDELNEEVDPLPLKKNIKKIQTVRLDTGENGKPEYEHLFKRDEVRVLNLEDMDEPITTMAKPPEPVAKESDYVKLLDKDDRSDIMERIKRYGDYSEDDLDEFEDDRLPVSTNEEQLLSDKRKALIKEALNENESLCEWENSLMNRAQVDRGPTLPQMHENPVGDHLESSLSRVESRVNQLKGQLKSLRDQKESSQKRKKELIQRMRQLGIQ